MAAKPKKIGEILIDEGYITPDQLDAALKKGGGRVGNVLVSMGYITYENIAMALAHQYSLEYIELKNVIIEPAVLKRIHEAVARRNVAIPLSVKGDMMVAAIADPLDVLAMDDFRRHCDLSIIRFMVSTEAGILEAINRHYLAARSIEDVVKTEDFSTLDLVKGEADAPGKLEKVADDISIVRMVNMIISQAVEARASDIHLEPDSSIFRVRFRIDGLLRDAANLPLKVHLAVTSRLKILSGMDIAEKRHPQDGRFISTLGEREIDIRASTLPAVTGEKMVLRLLDKGSKLLKIEETSPSTDSIALLKSLIKYPYGLILITGPTGSGKTTTLYSIMNQVDSVENNIISVEDPVEYHMSRINQVQVNPKAGLYFADVLRNILRQDPDIIIIGEIRDRETAQIAVNAALTGHLVFSTLHTNRIAGTVGRLIDMGVEPFLLASAIIGIATQRLVRKICPDCKVSYKPDRNLLEQLYLPKTVEFYRGDGCDACKGEGYKGRVAILEVVKMESELRKLTTEKADSGVINEALKGMGIPSLRTEGMKAVIEGITTVEEVMRVTQDVQDLG